MSKKILVVDDDPIMMDFVLLRLKDAGYEVFTASDGSEGLQKTRDIKPDLLVLDLAMPKMHGYEVCKAIRSDRELKTIKIVVTSGKNYAIDIRTAKEVGADRYLVKPYPVQELLDAIQELLQLPPGMKKKILIADDDGNIRLYLEKNLQDAGYQIFHAADGEETMRVVSSEKPDMVLLDLYMPKMHGYEVCKRIRADPDPRISAIKIIVISVKGYSTDIKTAKEVGANHYIVKPHSVKDLMAIVDKELGPATP